MGEQLCGVYRHAGKEKIGTDLFFKKKINLSLFSPYQKKAPTSREGAY
jgi:hypothetical protein